MKLIHAVLAAAIISSAPFSYSDKAAEEQAEKLLNTMDMEAALQQAISQMLDLQLQQNPNLSPYRGVMMQFFKKHMSYESLKPEVIEIYIEAFNAKELKKINDFYSTDIGKKTLQKMPVLMAKGGELGMRRVQENAEELRMMIQKESERLKKLQENGGTP